MLASGRRRTTSHSRIKSSQGQLFSLSTADARTSTEPDTKTTEQATEKWVSMGKSATTSLDTTTVLTRQAHQAGEASPADI